MNHQSRLDWYAMAQMAAQDYFSRLQMSGMAHPDMANFSALGALGSLNSNMAMGSMQAKPQQKRKDKGSSAHESSSSKVKSLINHSSKYFSIILILGTENNELQSINERIQYS